jgi:hydroxymethylpyrimidine/phosphomethylpyrimidine kinase
MVKRVLTIAGSDSGGGAGIQADLKTFQNLGVFGMSAITALTAQNTIGVQGIWEVPSSFLELQIRSVLSDIGADAVKTGMLFSRDLIETVGRVLPEYPLDILVVDPVMVSKSRARLLKEEAIEALKKRIIPLATIVTPNLDEAEALTGREVRTLKQMEDAAQAIIRLGCRSVLIKGGHLQSETASDIFYDGTRSILFEAPFIPTPHTHGTGCTLSSSLAAYLSLGNSLPEAIRLAKDYVTEAIRTAAAIGHGFSPVNHLAHGRDLQSGSLT